VNLPDFKVNQEVIGFDGKTEMGLPSGKTDKITWMIDLVDEEEADNEDDVQITLAQAPVNFRPNHYQYTKPPRKWCAFLHPTKLLKE